MKPIKSLEQIEYGNPQQTKRIKTLENWNMEANNNLLQSNVILKKIENNPVAKVEPSGKAWSIFFQGE